MALPTWFANTMTHLKSNQSRRARRRLAALRHTPAEPRLEKLEDRLLLSGFGTGDGAYIVEPWPGNYHAVQIQPTDSKIVAAGSGWVTADLTDLRMAVGRYDALGNTDTSYGSATDGTPAGVSTPPLGAGPREIARALVLQPDGKALLAGEVGDGGTQVSVLGVARLNTNGTPDSSFGSGGWKSFNVQPSGLFQTAYGVALQSTGKIVVSGSANDSVGSTAVVAGFTASGAVNSGKGGFGQIVQGKATGYSLNTFAGSKTNIFTGVATQKDDKLVVVGIEYAGGDGTQRLVVTRYTAAGVLDTTFNGSGYNVFLPAGLANTSANSVALQADGKIVAAGFCEGSDGRADMLVARFNTNGTPDTSFGGGSGYVRFDVDGAATATAELAYGVAIQPDGKIVAGGIVLGASTTGYNVLVARFNANGTVDGTFGTGGGKVVAGQAGQSLRANAVTLEADGNIIVAGNSQFGSDAPHPLLMRFFGSSASPLRAASVAPAIASLANAALVSVATAVNRVAAPKDTVVPPPWASGVAFVGNSVLAKSVATSQLGRAIGATVSPRRESSMVTSAVDRIFAEDDLLGRLLATDPLGFMNFKY